MNYNYFIPANSKKSMLIFGVFNTFDLILVGVGLGITFLGVLIVPLDSIAATVVAVLPGLITSLLVFPVPNYHNVLTLLISIYNFYTKEQNYIWKGWCFLDGKDDK